MSNTPKPQGNTVEQIREILTIFGLEVKDNPAPLIELHEIKLVEQQIQALITEATVDAYELLRWKYKELNHQTISKEFLEAYNTLMEEAQLKENK